MRFLSLFLITFSLAKNSKIIYFYNSADKNSRTLSNNVQSKIDNANVINTSLDVIILAGADIKVK